MKSPTFDGVTDLTILVQAGISCVLATSLAVYVAMLSRRSGPQWTLLAILVGIASWTAGAAVASANSESALGLSIAIPLIFLGSCFVPGLAFHLTARCCRVAIVEEQPLATMIALLVPGAIAYGLFLTNSMHGLFLTSTGFEILRDPATAWAGPGFWVHVATSYSLVVGAMTLSAVGAYRSGPSDERRRLVLLSLSSAIPVTANALHLFRLSFLSFPLTYAALGMTGLFLVVAIARYGFLESFISLGDMIPHLRAGIVLADWDGRVIGANEAAQSLAGLAWEDIRGRQIASVVEALGARGELAALVRDRPTSQPLVSSIETPAGRLLKVHSGSVRSRGATGFVRFLILDDHTERRRYEQVRQRVERLEAIGALVAGISHEINNPLSFVLSSANHVLRTVTAFAESEDLGTSELARELPDLREAATEAVEGLERIAGIVASTKQLMGDSHAPRERLDLNDVVRKSLNVATLATGRGSPSVELRLHSTPLLVCGSAVRLGQLVLNLLVNARDAVAELPDARVLVETMDCRGCAGCPGGVELRVQDNGPGIPDELRDRVFAPFFTTKGPDRGTGLGLAICAEIVRDHGGAIEVSSSASGGACLTVRLPPDTRACGLESA